MRSYSLISNVATSDKVFQNGFSTYNQLIEKKALDFWASEYSIDRIDEYASLVCEGDLLLEFNLKDFVMDNLSNVLQAGIGAALEGGISVAGLGTTAPAGVAAEACNDITFFGMTATSTISSIGGVFSNLSDLQQSVDELFSSTIESTPLEIYERVEDVIENIKNTVGEAAESAMARIGDALNKLIRKIAKSTGDAIAVFVPIPGADAIVQNLMAEFTDDVFEAFAKVYEKIPEFLKEWLHNPTKLKEGVMGCYDAAVNFIEQTVTANDNESFLGKVSGAILDKAVITILKVSGAGQKIIEWIRGNVPNFIDNAIKMIGEIYPIAIGSISAVSVLAKE